MFELPCIYDLRDRLSHTAKELRIAQQKTRALDYRKKPKHITSRPNQTGAGVHRPSHAISVAR